MGRRKLEIGPGSVAKDETGLNIILLGSNQEGHDSIFR